MSSEAVTEPTANDSGREQNEYTEHIIETLRASRAPLTVGKLFAELKGGPRPTKTALEPLVSELAKSGRLIEFAPYGSRNPRYFTNTPEEYAKGLLVDHLEELATNEGPQKERTLTKQGACSKVAKPAGLSVETAKKLLQELIDEGNVYRYPPLPRSRSNRFGTQPPEPDEYLQPLTDAVGKTAKLLAECDVEAWQVFHAAQRLLLEKLGLTEFDRSADQLLDRLRNIEPVDGSGVAVNDLQQSADFQLEGDADPDDLVEHLIATGRVFIVGEQSGPVTGSTRVTTIPEGRPRPTPTKETMRTQEMKPETTTQTPTERTSTPDSTNTSPPLPKPTVSDEELRRSILEVIRDLLNTSGRQSTLVPIHEVRDRIGRRHGPLAASHQVFDRQMKTLRMNNEVRLIAISNTRGITHEQLEAAIPGVGSQLFYVELAQ